MTLLDTELAASRMQRTAGRGRGRRARPPAATSPARRPAARSARSRRAARASAAVY